MRDFTHLAHLQVPPGSIRSARSAKGRPLTMENMHHTVESRRHTTSLKLGSFSSFSPYTYALRYSPTLIRQPTGSPSSCNDPQDRLNRTDQKSCLKLDTLNVVASQSPQLLSYNSPYLEVDLGWLRGAPPTSMNVGGVNLPPLTFLDRPHILGRNPIDEHALRAFSLIPW